MTRAPVTCSRLDGKRGEQELWWQTDPVPAQGHLSDGHRLLGCLGTGREWPTGALSPGLHSALGWWVFLPLVCTFHSSVDF